MPEIKNTFLKGRMNKDLDERLMPNGEYRDALNINVSTSEDSDIGTAQTILGNVRVEDLIPTDFTCVGSIADEKTNRLYWFVKNETTGVDAILEYQVVQNGDDITNIIFVDGFANTSSPVLRFPTRTITGINIIDNLLFWTDGLGEPKKINIDTCRQGTLQSAVALSGPIHTNLIVLGENLGNIEEENITVIKKKPTSAPLAVPKFTTIEDPNYNSKNSLFEKVFSRFSIRYKYQDNEYSAFGPFSNVVFNPEYVTNPHKYLADDNFTTYNSDNSYSVKEPFNASMVNKIDEIEIYNFISPDMPKDVVEVEILYKQENSPVVYSIAKINKKDTTNNYWESIGYNENSGLLSSEYKGKYSIITENIYAALPENQFIRVFDTVPKRALAQEITGNRIVYANYTQNYNLDIDSNGAELLPIAVTAGYEQRINNTGFDFSPLKSIKSLRNYQVGIIFGDEYGRETPVFTSASGAVTIPWQENGLNYNASSSLNLKASYSSNYPNWASYFKFYIKETSTEYYNLIMDKAYIPSSQDDQDRNIPPNHIWISFFSSDRSKIDIEDHIILKKILKDTITGQEPSNNKFKIIDIVNEAPESISYDFQNIASITNDTGNLSAVINDTNFSIVKEKDFLVFSQSDFHDKNVGAGGTFGTTDGHNNSISFRTQDMFISWYKLNSDGTKEYSREYRIANIKTQNNNYNIKIQKNITSEDAVLAQDSSNANNIDSTIFLNVFRKEKKELDQFSGRFFVKIMFDYIADGVREVVQDITSNYTSTATAKIKYWLDKIDQSGSRDERNKIVNWDGEGADSYTGTGAGTVGNRVLANSNATKSEVDWNQLYNHVTSGGAMDAFFIDNMYFVAGQGRPGMGLAKYAVDVRKGQSVGGAGTTYVFGSWSDTLSSTPTGHSSYSQMAGHIYGPDIDKNYFDYVKLHWMTGTVVHPSNNYNYYLITPSGQPADPQVGNNTDGPDFTTAINSTNSLGNSYTGLNNVGTGYNTTGNLQSPNAISPTYRWLPFAKDASVGYYYTGYFGQMSNGTLSAAASVNVNHPDVTTLLGTTTDWSSHAINFYPSMRDGFSTDFTQDSTFDPTKIVNSMEGIIITQPEHINGHKSWIDFNGTYSFSSTSLYGSYQPDDTYGSTDGKVYLHLSFLGPGKDLVPDTLDLTNADIKGPNCIGAYLQGIHGGGMFTKSVKDGETEGWEFKSTPDWDSPQIIECESSSNNTSTLDIGYDTNYQQLHDEQWDPTKGINGDPAGKIQNFLNELFVSGARFKFSGDTNNTVYNVLSVKKKHLYNHTPWKRRYVKRTLYTSSSTWQEKGNYSETLNLVPNGDSVEEAAVAWAKAKENNAPITSLRDTLEAKIENFGKANNRRIVYIIELDKNPADAAVNNGYNPIDANSGGSGIVAANTTNEIQFLNYAPGIVRGKVSNNPAIWETEPRENKNLEVYYEASNAIPVRLTDKTRELYAPVGCKVEVIGKPEALDGQISISEVFITGWSDSGDGRHVLNTTGFNQFDSSGNIIDYATPDPLGFSGTSCLLRCIRDDGSYTILRAIDSTIPQTINLTDNFIVQTKTPSGIDYGLSWYNCFSFGNGIESNRIRDDFNQMQITNGARASAVLNEPYAEETRKNGLIYSGIYNSISSINNLNQFIIGEKITKDLNPTYGSIQKLFQRRISLVAFCEDRVVSITSNKDALFNADGNPQLISSTNVLGDATPFVGNYGISNNPESFASDSYRAYFSDRARGAVLRLSKDGITPISDSGMKDWFRDNLPLFNTILGSYDSYNSDYNITLQNIENFGFNIISNSYLDYGVAVDSGGELPAPELIENPNFNNSTNSTWPLDLSDATVPQIVTQDTPSVTVYINEYQSIAQGYFQAADSSGVGNPGSGLPGDPGQQGNASTPPVYVEQSYHAYGSDPAHVYRLFMSQPGTTPHPDQNPFDPAKTASYAGDSMTASFGGSQTMYFLRFNESGTSNGHLGGLYEIGDTSQSYNNITRPYDGPAVPASTNTSDWLGGWGNVYYNTSFAGVGLSQNYGFNNHSKDVWGPGTTVEDVITFGYDEHVPDTYKHAWYRDAAYGNQANNLGVFTKCNGTFPTSSTRQNTLEATYSATDGSVYSGEHIVIDIAYIIHLGNIYLYDYDPSANGAPPNGIPLSGNLNNSSVPSYNSQGDTDWLGFVGTGDTIGQIKDDGGSVFTPSKSTPLPNQGDSVVNTDWLYYNIYDDTTDPANPVNIPNTNYHTPFSLPFHHKVQLYLFDGTTQIDSNMVDGVDGLNDSNDSWTDGSGTLESWVNTYQKDDGTGGLIDGEHYSAYMTSNQDVFTPTIYKVYGDHNQYGVVKMKVKIPIKDWFDPDDPNNSSNPTSMQTALSNMKMIDELTVKLKFIPCDHDGTTGMVATRNKIHLYRFNVTKQTYATSLPINYVTSYPAIAELTDLPPAPIPSFATVSYQLLDWNGFLTFSDLDTGFTTYGPTSAPGSDSGNGGGPTTYSWYTPPIIPVDPSSYTASDVAVIYNLTTGGAYQSTTGGSSGGFQMTDHLNVDQASYGSIFSIGQIALSPYGGKEFEPDHYYLLDIIYDETTSPTGKIFITGIFDKNNPPADGLAPGDSGYISGHFGITKDFGGTSNIHDALELQQVDRTTDIFSQFNYIAGQSSEDSNVFRAIFKVDSNSRIMTNASPHKTTEMNLAFEDYVGKIKKVVLKNIGSYALWDNGTGYPSNTSVDLPSMGYISQLTQGWQGHFIPADYNPVYHAMSTPVQYIKNNEINVNNGPQAQYSNEDTLWTQSEAYARYLMGQHANALNNYVGTNPIEAPQPTFDGYEIIFEVGNEHYTNTMSDIRFMYRSYDNTTEERKGFIVKNIDTPGVYRVIANFDGSTTLPNSDPWSLELDTGSGFEQISNTNSNATLSVSIGTTGTAISWNNYYGSYIFHSEGTTMVCSIKSLSVTDRTTYISTASSADSWTFNGFEPMFNEQNILWDNGTILINSNNTVTPSLAGISFPFVSAYQALPYFNLGDFYRLRFDYEELGSNQSPLIIYYYNNNSQGFEVQVPSGSGSYDQILTIGDNTATSPYQALTNHIVIIPSDSVNKSNYRIDNIFLQRAFMPPGTEPITVSFSEDVRGWTSFKSFIPESGLSLSKKYFTVNQGSLYEHNVSVPVGIYNNFYGIQYDSSITAVLNAEPSIIKSFKTLAYEGTQSKVDKYVDISIDGISYQDINNNLTSGDLYGTYHNIEDKLGWYVDSITTNKQEGFINEFLEKEGKWFNYIKGTRSTGNLSEEYIAQHTGDLSFQGISMISGAASSSSGLRTGNGNGNGNGNGTNGGGGGGATGGGY